MKKTLLVTVCLLFLFHLFTGNSAEGWEVDGYKWAKMSRDGKRAFIIGWANGGSEVMEKVRSVYFINVLGTKAKIDYHRMYDIVWGASKEVGVELYGLTVSQIVDMVDKVYSDPRVRTWKIIKIMPLVRGRLKEGWTERDLDEVIAYRIKRENLQKKELYYLSKSQSEREKLDEEIRQLELPMVWKALIAYWFEQ